jgi:hypothetical protein
MMDDGKINKYIIEKRLMEICLFRLIEAVAPFLRWF